MKFGLDQHVSQIQRKAACYLQNRTLGGVTKESATTAIEVAVKDSLEIGEQAATKIEQQLKTERENQKIITKSLNNTVSMLETKLQEAQKDFDTAMQQAKAKIRDIRKPKTITKTLENGNTETRKVNLNGATMVHEVSPSGKAVKTEVTLLDGSKRRTTYNPTTGKPMKTFTNVNEDKIIKYDHEGKSIKQEAVNVKKVVTEKPKMVAQEILEDKNGVAIIKRSFSDGSYEIINYSKTKKAAFFEKRFDANGTLKSETQSYFNSDGLLSKETKIYEEEKITEKIIDAKKFKKITRYGNDDCITEQIYEYPSGHKKIIKSTKDEYGFINESNRTVKYIYPKTTKIKESNITFSDKYTPAIERLKMRDGSTIELSKINSDYFPCKVEVISKDGSTKVIENRQEIRDLIENIGKVEYRWNDKLGEDYYVNFFIG